MSKQLPYYKMYPADADADERYSIMTMEQRGVYWTLLNKAWTNDGLPFETERLARLCSMTDEQFKKVWVVVGECFFLDKDRLRNKRQEKEKLQAIESHSKRSKAGSKGAEVRWDGNAMALLQNGNGNAISRAYDSVSSEETKKKDAVNFDVSDAFEKVYGRHPKKKHRVLAEQVFATLAMSGYDLGTFDRAHKAWCASDAWRDKNGQFAPPLDEWIVDRGYEFMPEGTPAAKPPRKQKAPILISPDEKQFLEWRKEQHGF